MDIPTATQELKKLFEAKPLFKPATSAQVAIRKKAYDAARGSADVCPHCHVDLREEGINSTEYLTSSVYRTYYYNDNTRTWEIDDQYSEDYDPNEEGLRHEEFSCGHCDKKIQKGVDFDIQESVIAEATPLFKPATPVQCAMRMNTVRTYSLTDAEVFGLLRYVYKLEEFAGDAMADTSKYFTNAVSNALEKLRGDLDIE